MYLIRAEQVSKFYNSPKSLDGKLKIAEDFSLEIAEGELVTMFGPNGCGKTTILNLFAGTVLPETGKIRWNNAGDHLREVGYVFQNYTDTLLPWRTVKGNITFPLEVRGTSENDTERKTDKVLSLFRLHEHSNKYVYELSGGLKQLVAIARSTVYNPRLLLLDEPFSALDYSTSRMLWTRFREFWSDTNVTTMFVSHNIDEAVFLGDRVCVMSSCPTRIVAEIPVPFGRDRQLDILGTREFFDIRTKVLKAFESGRDK